MLFFYYSFSVSLFSLDFSRLHLTQSSSFSIFSRIFSFLWHSFFLFLFLLPSPISILFLFSFYLIIHFFQPVFPDVDLSFIHFYFFPVLVLRLQFLYFGLLTFVCCTFAFLTFLFFFMFSSLASGIFSFRYSPLNSFQHLIRLSLPLKPFFKI